MVGFSGKERKLGEAAAVAVRAAPAHSRARGGRRSREEPPALCACPPPHASPPRAQITSNMKNTVTGLKAIIGKKFHSEDVQIEMQV